MREAEEIDELVEYWEAAGGAKLNQLLIAKLNGLLEKKSLAELKSAIDRANDGANNPDFGFSLEYMKSKLTETKEKRAKNAKEATENGGYAKPVYGGDEDWANS